MSLFKRIKEKRDLAQKKNTYEYWKSLPTDELCEVPVKFRDRSLCLAYIAKRSSNVLYVPVELFEYLDFCVNLVKYNIYSEICFNTIVNIFQLHHEKKLYKAALKENWYFISCMDIDFLDDELWQVALKSSEGRAFEYYPEEKKQKLKYEDYFKLVKYPYALSYVPLNYRDKAMCLEALKHVNSKDITSIYTYVFDPIPKAYKNEEMYLAMVKACPSYLEKVPDKYYENVRIAYNKHLEESSEQSNENVSNESNI